MQPKYLNTLSPGQTIETFKATYPNIVGPTFASCGQTIAAFQYNISQHCWTQHVACVWPPCCNMLRVVGSSLKLGKFEPTTPNMVAKRSQQVAPNNVATCCVGILRSFGRGFTWKIYFIDYIFVS